MNCKLSDYFIILSGGTPKTSVSAFWGGSIPWLSVKDFNNGQRYVYSSEKTITKEGLDHCPSQLLKKDDIIISARGTVGVVAMIPFDMAFNQSCFGLRAKPGVDPSFLYYLVKHSVNRLKQISNGSVFDTITRDSFSGIYVPTYNPDVQQKIGQILGAIDDKIENNKRINGCLVEQVLAVFDSTFPFGPNDDLPHEWKKTCLGRVTKQLNERVGSRPFKVLSAVNSGELVYSEDYFTKQVFSKSIDKYVCVPPKSFAYNPARVNIGSIGMNEFEETGCVSPVYVAFSVEDGYEGFFKLFIKTPLFKAEAETRASGSVRQSMNYGDFALIEIAYPPRQVVLRFNEAVRPLLSAQKQIAIENNQLSKLRDELLPRLMSGEINVGDIEV